MQTAAHPRAERREGASIDIPSGNVPEQTSARIDTQRTLGDICDFIEACRDNAWFFNNGWISKQIAVDNSWRLAERWLLTDEIGIDAVQAILAAAFALVPR